MSVTEGCKEWVMYISERKTFQVKHQVQRLSEAAECFWSGAQARVRGAERRGENGSRWGRRGSEDLLILRTLGFTLSETGSHWMILSRWILFDLP